MLPAPIAVTLQVIQVLDDLDIPHFVGGSLASAVHGVLRTTLDADIVARVRIESAAPLYAALESTFYVSAEAITEAIEHGTSFNAIHLTTVFKVDIFLSQQRPYDLAQFERRSRQIIGIDTATSIEYSAYVASAEDTILSKLRWYRAGGEVSERQWRDVLGVLKIQSTRLDYAYLLLWSGQIGVEDLLQRAVAECR